MAATVAQSHVGSICRVQQKVTAQQPHRSSDLLVPSHSFLQLHNEDDSSEASSSEQQPCNSNTAQAAAAASSQDHSQAPTGLATATVPQEALASCSQGEGEALPPPYASIDLGATAAAPGVCGETMSFDNMQEYFLFFICI